MKNFEAVINCSILQSIELKVSVKELSDEDILKNNMKVVKELEEENESFTKPSSEEKVNELNKEIEITSVYLPNLLNEEEIRNIFFIKINKFLLL